MRVQINTSIEPLPGEDGLIDRMAMLELEDQGPFQSWIGVCNARCELRLIVESLSESQDEGVTHLLLQTGLLSQVDGGALQDEVFVDEIESLDRVFMVSH